MKQTVTVAKEIFCLIATRKVYGLPDDAFGRDIKMGY